MLTLALALTLSLLPPSNTVVFNQEMNPQEQQMANLLVEYETRINNQDAGSFSQIFTEDAIRMGPNSGYQVGREGIRAAQQGAFDQFHFNVTFSIHQIREYGRWGDGIAFVDAYLTPASGGSPVHVAFRALFVFQHTNQGWLISRQMWNTQPPA
jgi:ketosteroid isomerase-like protein